MNTTMTLHNGNTALEVHPDYIPVAGIEQLSPDDFSIPVYKLIQLNTKIEGADQHAGKWYRTDTGEIRTTDDVLIIGICKARVLFPSDYDGNGVTLCRSDDGRAARQEFIGHAVYYRPADQRARAIVAEASADEGDPSNYPIPVTCAECALSQWIDGNKPPCRLSDNWAALTSEGDPVLLRFGGSAAKISAKLRNLARVATAKRRPLYVRLGSHFIQDEIGNYHVPDVTLIKEPLPAELLEMAKAFTGVNLAARAAEMMDAEDIDGGPRIDPNYDEVPQDVMAEEIPF